MPSPTYEKKACSKLLNDAQQDPLHAVKIKPSTLRLVDEHSNSNCATAALCLYFFFFLHQMIK